MRLPPLVVDLDGTLLQSDLLLESGLAFLRTRPQHLLLPLGWLLAGKARLKGKLAAAVELDVATLPYDTRVLELIRKEKARGREIVLATASHRAFAEQVAAHLQLFDRVLATDGGRNLSAQAKREALIDLFGEGGFDYIGNDRADLPVWAAAGNAYVVNPGPGVEARARQQGNVTDVMPGPGGAWRHWLRSLRLHQWLKNMLVFVPLLASHRLLEPSLLGHGMIAFLLFGLCASSVYVLNDLLDLPNDRLHPRKRLRPFASGNLSLQAGLLTFPLLLVVAFGGALLLLPLPFAVALGAYYVITLAYSLALKRIMMLDVITLAILYTVRIVAGANAFPVHLTFWMLAFSMFMFLSLAMVKRYAELREERSNGKSVQTSGRGYFPDDLEMIASLGAASGYIAVMVLALYIQDPSTVALYHHPQVIWLACPVLLFWISRTWLVTHRGEMHDDPVVFAIKDRISLLTGVVFGLIFWLAA